MTDLRVELNKILAQLHHDLNQRTLSMETMHGHGWKPHFLYLRDKNSQITLQYAVYEWFVHKFNFMYGSHRQFDYTNH